MGPLAAPTPSAGPHRLVGGVLAPITAAEARHMAVVTAGPGLYGLAEDVAGRRQFALDAAGEPYRLDLRRLLDVVHARQGPPLPRPNPRANPAGSVP